MKFNRSLIAAALLAAAAGAHADDYTLPFVATPGGGFTGSFDAAVNGLFVDSYRFTPASFAGTVSVTFAALTPAVTFAVGDLNGQTFGTPPEGPFSPFRFAANVGADMPLLLTILGGSFAGAGFDSAVDGRYRLSVVATPPVPEPGTYALLLAGLAGVGWAARRRRAQPLR